MIRFHASVFYVHPFDRNVPLSSAPHLLPVTTGPCVPISPECLSNGGSLTVRRARGVKAASSHEVALGSIRYSYPRGLSINLGSLSIVRHSPKKKTSEEETILLYAYILQ